MSLSAATAKRPLNGLTGARPAAGDQDGSASTSSLEALGPLALEGTRAAALACQPHVGGGDRTAADAAASAAMRAVLARAPGRGIVVIGEGEKDDAPMLHPGEALGAGESVMFDLAVDPLEGTKACAAGLPGSMSTIALATRGTLDVLPACSWYMEKLLVGRRGRGALDIARPPAENAINLAARLEKPVSELGVVVLDKPRHRELIDVLRGLGARVHTPLDGDVGAGLLVLLESGSHDLLIGVGGTPEGVLTACAAVALGGELQARLAPQHDQEMRRLRERSVDLSHVYDERGLVAGESLFAACGVTTGELLRGPRTYEERVLTESLLVTAGSVSRVTETTFVQVDGSHPVESARPLAGMSGLGR
ncbi:MAG TPA: fructose-bisphosphatase class II [Solirubrobacteraceae bacterium]|nr:fructose-bisphosphatase class II [Solirubrobacteraceae bacterium]